MTTLRCTPTRHVFVTPKMRRPITYPHAYRCVCGDYQRTATLIDDGARVRLEITKAAA